MTQIGESCNEGVDTAETVTTALAVYAALVSTSAIAWQIVSWRLARRTLLKIHVTRHLFTRTDEAGETTDDNLIVSVINVSEHPVRITKARLANEMMVTGRPMGVEVLFALTPDADRAAPGMLDLGDTLARVIEARDSAEAIVPTRSLEPLGIQPWLPLAVYVLTATDDWFSSDAVAYPEAKDPATSTASESGRARVGARPSPRATGTRATRPRRRRPPAS